MYSKLRSEPCDASMAAFLAEGAQSDLILRVDESVVASEPADEPSEDGARLSLGRSLS